MSSSLCVIWIFCLRAEDSDCIGYILPWLLTYGSLVSSILNVGFRKYIFFVCEPLVLLYWRIYVPNENSIPSVLSRFSIHVNCINTFPLPQRSPQNLKFGVLGATHSVIKWHLASVYCWFFFNYLKKIKILLISLCINKCIIVHEVHISRVKSKASGLNWISCF